MTARLQAAGVRPISPIVDITNYVLIELGHPMHAFDLAQARRRRDPRPPRARRARRSRRSTASTRTLDADMLVIADRDRAQAVAGVMGGAASEVSRDHATRRVRERVLQAGLGPADEQAPRPQDRGLVAVRARRRHQRAGRRAPARGRADGADRRRPASSAPIVDCYPHAARAASGCTCGASGWRALLGVAVPDADVERILRGLGLDGRRRRRRLGRRSRRPSASICCARSISSRKSAGTTASTSSTRRSRS